MTPSQRHPAEIGVWKVKKIEEKKRKRWLA
jgi:hypothetical protein